jgi:hypothetical protein
VCSVLGGPHGMAQNSRLPESDSSGRLLRSHVGLTEPC